MWSSIVRYQWVSKLHQTTDTLYPLAFFIMVLVIFPISLSISMGTESAFLSKIATPAVWIAALLATLLSATQVFNNELKNGYIEQLLVARVSLTLWVMCKLAIHWCVDVGLLLLASIVLMPLYAVDWQTMQVIILSLCLGTPVILLFTALASALTAPLSAGNAMVPLIALPLQLPVIIFAISMIQLYHDGHSIAASISLLLALLIFSMMIIPWAIATALKLSL